MRLVGMDATRRQQAQDMGGAAALLQCRHETLEDRQVGDRTVGDGVINAGQVLKHHAPGAQVHVADLGIAHLPGRQADMAFRSVEMAFRAGCGQAVEDRRPRKRDGVVIRFFPFAPAVQYTQQDRAPFCRFFHAHSGQV